MIAAPALLRGPEPSNSGPCLSALRALEDHQPCKHLLKDRSRDGKNHIGPSDTSCTRLAWRFEGENRCQERQRRQRWRDDWIRISAETGASNGGCGCTANDAGANRAGSVTEVRFHSGPSVFLMLHPGQQGHRGASPQWINHSPFAYLTYRRRAKTPYAEPASHPMPSLFSWSWFRCDSRQRPGSH